MTPPTTQVIDRAAGDKQAKSVMAIADCDIHVVPGNYEKELYPFLAKRWQDYLATYGTRPRQGYGTGPAYPKGSRTPRAATLIRRTVASPALTLRSCGSITWTR